VNHAENGVQVVGSCKIYPSALLSNTDFKWFG